MNYKKIELDNGLRVISSPMKNLRSVSVVFFVLSGNCYETARQAGISHFIEHMCFKGTRNRKSSLEISESIERLGGILNGSTDRELTTFWCKIASQHVDASIDVIVDLLRNPLFRKGDVVKERQVIIEEINMSLDYPQQRVNMLLDDMIWPGLPLGRDVAGTRETVSAITAEQMLERVHQYYTPDNILVSVAGDITQREVVKLLEQKTRGWKQGKKPRYIDSKSNQKKARVLVEERDIEQVNLVMGTEGLSFSHPDRFALDLMNMVLGGGMSSRLFVAIREKMGLTYDIHSYVEQFRNTGEFVVQASLEPDKMEKAVKAVITQLKALSKDISADEVAKAKEMSRGRLLLSMENSRSIAGWYGAQEILLNRILTVDEILALIDAVSVEDVRRVAGEIIQSNKMNMAVVGPVKNKKSLEELLKF